jgi:hypothetical protein
MGRWPRGDARTSDTRSDMNRHTRAYVKQVRGCVAIATLSLSVASNQSVYAATDTIKRASDTFHKACPSWYYAGEFTYGSTN